MSGPETARRRVTGEMTDAMRGAVLDELQDVALDRLAEGGHVLALISRAASTVASVMSLWGEISNIYDMALAGYNAMITERRMLQRVAGAHAYGYWLFQDNPGLYPPTAMPLAQQIRIMARGESDRDIGRRIGNENYSSDGGLTFVDWQNIWGRAARNMIEGLEDDLMDKARRGVLTPPLRDALGAQARIDGNSAAQLAALYRTVVLGVRYRHSPSLAARAFFLGSLKDEARLEREMSLRLYASIPYTPPERGTRG